MKIVVIGGTGLIGSRLVQSLRAGGHEALSASPSLEDRAVPSFLQQSGSNLLPAGAARLGTARLDVARKSSVSMR